MSEIASCSYEARAVGVRNGMFLGSARKLCPDIHCVPYQFEEYRQVSQKLYDILVSYSHEIEAVSCDEAYIDVSDALEGMNRKYFGKFKQWRRQRERQKSHGFRLAKQQLWTCITLFCSLYNRIFMNQGRRKRHFARIVQNAAFASLG